MIFIWIIFFLKWGQGQGILTRSCSWYVEYSSCETEHNLHNVGPRYVCRNTLQGTRWSFQNNKNIFQFTSEGIHSSDFIFFDRISQICSRKCPRECFCLSCVCVCVMSVYMSTRSFLLLIFTNNRVLNNLHEDEMQTQIKAFFFEAPWI